MTLRPTSMAKSPRMVPGADSWGRVAPEGNAAFDKGEQWQGRRLTGCDCARVPFRGVHAKGCFETNSSQIPTAWRCCVSADLIGAAMLLPVPVQAHWQPNSPIMARPTDTTLRPSHTMATTGPEQMYSTCKYNHITYAL